MRIRLEGRVEALETEVRVHEEALLAAKARDFERAADVLSIDPLRLPSHGDDGLLALLKHRDTVRMLLSRCVEARLRTLGMPAIDLAAGARWLVNEPVLYEHHRLTPAFAIRSVHLAAFIIGLPTALATLLGLWPVGLVVGVGLYIAAIQLQGWSDAILTEHRLILDGRVAQLAGLWKVALVRPWFQQSLPLSWEVELHYRGQEEPRLARLRHASLALRCALQKLRIDTGNDWGPW